MKYIYNPVTGTLDDVETPNLGEKYFASAETDEIIKTIDEKFGPGTMFPASDAPIPPKTIERDMFDNAFRNNAANGGMMRKNFADNPLKNFDKPVQKKINTTTESINFFVNKFGKNVLDKITKEKFGLNFNELFNQYAKEDPKGAFKNFKKRLVKFEDFIIQNKRMPTETEARKLGRVDRDKTIFETTGEVKEETVRNKLIKDGKPAETFKGKVIFADKNIQDLFEAELNKRYSFARTSDAGEKAGVLTNQQIYEKFLKPAGYSESSVRTIVDDYKKSLNLDFQELTSEQKEAKKLERDREEKISQGGKRVSGTVDNPAHHMFPLGDQIGAKPGEFTIIPKAINGQISYANKQMKKLILERRKLLDKVKIDQTVNIKDLTKELDNINKKAEEVIKNHYKKYPKHKGLLNWKKIDFVLDDVGRLLNVRQVGTIGGDYKKWTLANIDKTILNKDIAKLNKEELRDFRTVIEEASVARDAGEKGAGAKEGSPIKNLFKSLKNKLDTSRMFTSRIPGGAIALTPADFIISMGSGMPLLESAASAASYLIKDPALGKAVNIPLAMLQDMQDPEATFKKAGERKEKIENFLDDLTGTDSDKPFVPQLIEKLSNMEAGDQPDIDPYQAAKGGLIPDQEIMNYATGGRVNFDEGSPKPQLDGNDFLNELEFKFNNIDSVTLDDTPITFDDSKSSAAQVADLFNPKNVPYYADMAVRAGLRVGEFGTRILPATGQLISDVLQKPMFKVKSSYAREDDNEILDYGETPENNNVKFVGGPIFKNFLKNITPTSTEKLVGLDTIINEEKKKMIERGSSSLPVKVAETAALGGELIAPIFPGLKLLRAYAKSKSLPVNDDTKQLLEQDVDMVLESNGMDRRQFLQITGTGGAVILAKMLGFTDEFATATKVAEKATAEAVSTYPPPYFFKLVEKINSMGDDITKKAATQEREIVKSYKDYEMTEDLATGEIVIRKRNEGVFYDQDGIISDEYIVYKPGQADELTKGKTPPAQYDEYTVRPDGEGKLTDSEDGLDSIEEILEEVGDPDSLTLKR